MPTNRGLFDVCNPFKYASRWLNYKWIYQEYIFKDLPIPFHFIRILIILIFLLALFEWIVLYGSSFMLFLYNSYRFSKNISYFLNSDFIWFFLQFKSSLATLSCLSTLFRLILIFYLSCPVIRTAHRPVGCSLDW